MKVHFLNKILSFCFVGILFLTNTNCQENIDFQRISFDWSKDYIAELAQGFKPELEYDYWACLRSGLPEVSSTSVLYDTNELGNANTLSLLKKGFYRQGHVADRFYYIATVKGGNTNYITDVPKLLEFFGDIDTMEEALMIAKINGFGVDGGNPKGSSYRPTDDGFEFLLMKNEEIGLITFRQYFVSVDYKGFVKSEKKEIYCEGYIDCYQE